MIKKHFEKLFKLFGELYLIKNSNSKGMFTVMWESEWNVDFDEKQRFAHPVCTFLELFSRVNQSKRETIREKRGKRRFISYAIRLNLASGWVTKAACVLDWLIRPLAGNFALNKCKFWRLANEKHVFSQLWIMTENRFPFFNSFHL